MYTFNGLGEYTLLVVSDGSGRFTFQGRTELAAVNSTATTFSAFAFGDTNATIVEVRSLYINVSLYGR